MALKATISLIALLFCKTVVFSQQNKYWQQKADYNIDVTLNDSAKTLEGFETIEYFNNSPDTLNYIWFHLWPNAYKNDKTAFSNQLLENGRTDFYFADESMRGYINHLNFKVDDVIATTLNHPLHQDIIKLVLPSPLLPSGKIKISTPFHVKLPFNFSRGGYINHSFQITQWYPKPAVYDKNGWHEMPYLDQGEFYSEFGNFKVNISVPKDLIVAATGEMSNEVINDKMKTLTYEQNDVHDFAWFADKDFIVDKDSLQLNNRIIEVYSYHYKRSKTINSIDYIKSAIKTKSKWLGDYPYNTISVVESPNNHSGGMEYPTITFIDKAEDGKSHDLLINHEVGHNWFYGILASNEREHPWMDEGMNTYYDNRYTDSFYYAENTESKKGFIAKRIPEDFDKNILQSLIKNKKDQPISTKSETFTSLNYNLIAYNKTAIWMKEIENKLGRIVFDSMMRNYFNQWKFKHPTPEDFKSLVEQNTPIYLKKHFELLNDKGFIKQEEKRKIKLYPFFSFRNTEQYNYQFVSPALGYNDYDKWMLGLAFHNYTLPSNKFEYFITPLYSKTTKQWNGTGYLSFHSSVGTNGAKMILSLRGGTFSMNKFIDSTNTSNFLRYSKINPSIKIIFGNKNPRSTIEQSISLNSFFINETALNFTKNQISQQLTIDYPVTKRYLHQISFDLQNYRVLYPYKASLLGEQGNGFVKLGFTGNYYFNYVKGGGLSARIYTGKFIYTKEKTSLSEYETSRYHINMSGANGNEDYTYSNYFIGRNEFEGFATRQLMMKEGGFKVHTDLLSEKIGKTDNWLGAINLTSTIPKNINPLEAFPIKIPLKIFFDLGTYSNAWEQNPPTEKLLYDAGFQISLLKDIVNIYFPVVYSKSYKDYFKSVLNEKIFMKNISFNIDLQKINLKNLFPEIAF